MKHSTAIAVSGGIDSLVAAHLLKEQGHNIIPIHFTTGYGTHSLDIVSHISAQLEIEVNLIDCSIEFKKKVVDYFTQTYRAGQTPNPCMVCNPSIKFGTVFDFARKLGASSIATGHYARINRGNDGNFHLLKGIDSKKDQSYFLALMSQKQLSTACFPLGGITKSQVRQLAVEKGLEPSQKRESQDVCFTKDRPYGEFLSLQPNFEAKPGLIEDANGKILGEHKGLHLFTIGQRRGINCPASEPYYVIDIDPNQNRLKVGFKRNLLSSECKITDINWINQNPNIPLNVLTRVRYRHHATASKLFPVDANTAIVRFENPQSAITPGQCAVFYRDDEVIGGGWISSERV